MPAGASTAPTLVRGACPRDCPDTCAWHISFEDGVATKLVGDPAHPFPRGGLCTKVNLYLDRVYSPNRVRAPLQRVGAKDDRRFVRVTWDQALEGIIATDGPTATLSYGWMGTQRLLNWASLDRRFFARQGATLLVRNVCGPGIDLADDPAAINSPDERWPTSSRGAPTAGSTKSSTDADRPAAQPVPCVRSV